MSLGHKQQALLGFFAGLIFVTTTWADTQFKARLLDTGETVYAHPYQRIVVPDAVIGIELTASFTNTSGVQQKVKLAGRYGQTVPDFLGRWEDQTQWLAAGASTQIIDTIFVHIQGPDTVAFTMDAVELQPNGTPIVMYAIPFTFIVDTLSTADLERPSLLDEAALFSDLPGTRRYAAGTSVTLQWQAAEAGASVTRIDQDLYSFDLDHPGNLARAVQGLYKSAAESRTSAVHGLKDGHTYGYVVKALYIMSDGTEYTLYSNVLYATQDQTPPESVAEPTVNFNGDGYGVVTWTAVEDVAVLGEASGVTSYKIYRSVDTRGEALVATVPADGALTWTDPERIVGLPFYYRIRAVDGVGNLGEGAISAPLLQEGDTQWPDPVDPDSSDSVWTVDGFFQGTVDTLWLEVESWVKSVRFLAARDDAALLDTSAAARTMPRAFDTGWMAVSQAGVSAAKPGYVYYVFDYALQSDGQALADLNFVSGHVYLRQGLKRDVQGTVYAVDMETRYPDAQPPSDIQNLTAEARILDASVSRPPIGYTDWQIDLRWNAATDDASGIAGYRIYRQIVGVDANFVRVATSKASAWTDPGQDLAGLRTGATLNYRVVAVDAVGNVRGLAETQWTATALSLSAPHFVFDGQGEAVDTLFSAVSTINIRLSNFHSTPVQQWVVSMNDQETVFNPVGSSIYTVPLATTQFSRIKVRAVFQGGRSSLWSNIRVVSLKNQRPDEMTVLRAIPDSASWLGHLYVQWNRASLDNDHYELERSLDGQNWTLMDDNIRSDADTVRWVDRFAFDEVAGVPGDTLVAYKPYFYRARMVSTDGTVTPYSEVASNHCGNPPVIASDELISDWNGGLAIRIYWDRARPTVASGWARTRVSVSLDSLPNVIYLSDPGTGVVDDQSFVFGQSVEMGRNYIFRIQETTELPAERESNWSMPYTVNLATFDSLFVQPQPRAKVFLHWGSDPLLQRLPVQTLRLVRQTGGVDQQTWTFDAGVPSFMDEGPLGHGVDYTYRLEARNDLGQILAWDEETVTADTGLVFVPRWIESPLGFFNGDSVDLAWTWEDLSGQPATEARGAVRLCIQTSSSALFPNAPDLTVTSDCFSADALHPRRRVAVPPSVDNNNEVVYCRVTAQDRWGNPATAVWSGVAQAIYDDVKPTVVTDLSIDGALSYYGGPQQILVSLSWEDASLQGAERLVRNVHGYWVLRQVAGAVDTAGFVLASASQLSYAFQDTAFNAQPEYAIVSMDSAANQTATAWMTSPNFVTTPPPPEATGHRSVTALPLEGSGFLYQLEAATDPRHFVWAHEMGVGDPNNRLLWQSDWQEDLGFACTSGWGSVVTDTTWFRVKARTVEGWESGWSEYAYYTESDGQSGKSTGVEEISGSRPTAFEVYPNYPNPFNAETRIRYGLPSVARVEITLYNIRGVRLISVDCGEQSAGTHAWTWNGRDAQGQEPATGLYIALVTATDAQGKRLHKQIKMMLLK